MWRLEAARVAPSLKQIRVDAGGGRHGGWPLRVETLGSLSKQYLTQAPPAATALEKVLQSLAKDLNGTYPTENQNVGKYSAI